MRHKRILVAVAAAALLFGVGASGCNRNADTRVASASVRPSPSSAAASSRPAEVLAASTHRAPTRRAPIARPQYPALPARAEAAMPMVNGRQLARFEPLPEPVPVNNAYASAYPAQQQYYGMPAYPAQSGSAYAAAPQAYQMQSGPAFASSGAAPVYNRTAVPGQAPVLPVPPAPEYVASSGFISEPYVLVPSRTNPGFYDKVYDRPVAPRQPPYPPVANPAPDLVMARAQLQGSAPLSDRVVFPQAQASQTPPNTVPLPTPRSYSAPIPELQPIRYNGQTLPARRRAVPVALTPVEGWVASPATAMR